MKKQKKVKLLVFLSVILAGILTWQWIHRDRAMPFVDNKTEQEALAALEKMLETGKRYGWKGTEKYWISLPDEKTRMEYQKLMGGPEFTFQGSFPVEAKPEEVILYGMFDAGIPVEILMSRQNDEFKILSMKKAVAN